MHNGNKTGQFKKKYLRTSFSLNVKVRGSLFFFPSFVFLFIYFFFFFVVVRVISLYYCIANTRGEGGDVASVFFLHSIPPFSKVVLQSLLVKTTSGAKAGLSHCTYITSLIFVLLLLRDQARNQSYLSNYDTQSE